MEKLSSYLEVRLTYVTKENNVTYQDIPFVNCEKRHLEDIEELTSKEIEAMGNYVLCPGDQFFKQDIYINMTQSLR